MSILEIIIVATAFTGLLIWGILLIAKAKRRKTKKETDEEVIEIKKEEQE